MELYSRTMRLVLVLGGALGFFLGFPNPWAQIPPLVLLAPLAAYILAASSHTFRQAFGWCWLLSMLGLSAGLYWLSLPMHDFAYVPWVLAALAVMLLCSYLGLYVGLAGGLGRLFRLALPAPVAAVGFGLAWGGCEVLRGYIFTGFPWLTLATAFAPLPEWIQAASLFGSYGLSALYAALAALAGELLLGCFCGLRQGPGLSLGIGGKMPSAAGRIALVAFIVLSFAGLRLYGRAELSAPCEPPCAGNQILAGLVQGNVDQNQKWAPVYQAATVRRYIDLSSRLFKTSGQTQDNPCLLIWPETAMPFAIQGNPELASHLRDFARARGCLLVFGAPGYELPAGKKEKAFNRIWAIDKDGVDLGHYDKEHLVPFGEYVPLRLPLPFVENFLQGQYFTPGTAEKPIRSGNLVLGPLICYEAIFPELSQQRVEDGANILVNVSNDAWFGRSSAPEQHLQMAVMRAVEQGRDFLRCTNTGISAHIDKNGRILKRGGLFMAEAISSRAVLHEAKTLYHDFYFYIMAILVGGPAGLAVFCKLRIKWRGGAPS